MRVVVRGAVNAESGVEVFAIPENAIKRALRRVGRSPGRYRLTLPFEAGAPTPTGLTGVSTEPWPAEQLYSEVARPTTYVARHERTVSGPLDVFTDVSVSVTRHRGKFGLELDVSALAGAVGLAGLPLPGLSAETGETEVSATAIVRATQDPAVELRVMNPNITGAPLARYLEAYLAAVAAGYDLPEARLVAAFNDVHAEYLRNPVELGGEARPYEVNVGPDHDQVVTIELYPGDAHGSTLLAIAAVRPGTEELVAVSELIGITIDEDGFVSRDF